METAMVLLPKAIVKQTQALDLLNGLELTNTVDNMIWALSEYNGGLRLRDYSETTALTIVGGIIDFVYKMIGVSKLPKPEMEEKNFRVVKYNYSFLYPYEIELAFDYAMSKDSNVKIDHFNTFSQKYLTTVLNSYMTYRASILIARRNSKKPVNIVKELPSPDNKLQGYYETIDIICNSYEEHLAGKALQPDNYMLPFIYDFLDKNKLVGLTNDEKRSIFNDAADVMNNRLMLQAAQKGVSVGVVLKEIVNKESYRVKISKELALPKIFDIIRLSGLNLKEELIKKVNG